MTQLIEAFNAEVDRYRRTKKPGAIDDFVDYSKLKWTHNLKAAVERGQYASFDPRNIRVSFYRPFCRKYLYFDRMFNERVYRVPRMFPQERAEGENQAICCTIHTQMPFEAQITDRIPNEAVGGRNGQCFPFYDWNEEGTRRRENITDWALEHFRKHYIDKKITKWDIFYYAYGILHQSEYRLKYAENLKRELPRIPLANDFWGFSKAGKELAGLHIEYESLGPYPLKFIETTVVAPASRRQPDSRRDGSATIPLSYRVEDKMRLAKDHRSLKVKDSLTLGGIPPETFEYRLGNRSALEWVIDQYQVREDKHSGIRSDPNRVRAGGKEQQFCRFDEQRAG
jgi:predicted helicase